MTILGTHIVTKSRHLLQDRDGVRWDDAECLLWLNECRREAAKLKPSIFGNGTEVTHLLTAGCKQRIDTAGAYKIDSINYNVASGKAIRPTTKDQLDAFRPAWRADTGTDVQNWFSDETDPLSFWVYPAAAGKEIKAHVHIAPPDMTSLSDTVVPLDIYEGAFVNYLCFRAMSKDAEYGGNAQIAAAYLQLFTAALT